MRKLALALAALLTLLTPASSTLFLGDDAQFHAITGTTTDLFVDVTAAPYNAKCDGVTDDTAAIQAAGNAAVAAHITLYIPPSNSGCIISRNGSNGWCLQFTGPLIIWGIPTRSILFPAAGVGNTISIIQFVGNGDIGKTGVYGLFIGNPSTGQRTGGHALDFESQQPNQAFPSSSFIEMNYFATPTTGTGFSIFASNSAANNPDGGFARTIIKDNVVGSGIDLQQSGDSVKIDHNVFITNGSNSANPGILANLVTGAGNLQVIHNNCSIDNSCLEVDCATTVHVMGNEFEHQNIANFADPLLNIKGNICFVTGGDVTENQLQAVTGGGSPTLVNLDKARGVSLDLNRMATPTNYIPVVITANADTNIVGASNKFFTASTFISDAAISTHYANAQHYVGHSLHSATCAVNTTCAFLNDIQPGGSDVFVYDRAATAGLFKNLLVWTGNGTPGGTGNYVVTFRQNSGNTTITCTITTATNTCTDLTHSVALAQGDQWNFSIVVSATAANAAQDIQWSIEYDPSVQ